MIKYLVTGAAGHLGLNVVKRLVELKKQVKALVLPNDLNVKNLPAEVEIFYGDVTKYEDVKEFLKNIDEEEQIIIHCAGIVSIESKFNQLIYDVNVTGTKNMVNASLNNKVKKFIYVSSVHAIKEAPKGETIKETKIFNSDEVIGLYAKTKSEATAYVLESIKKGLNGIIVHPSGIAGPDDYGRGHITQLIIDFYKGRLTAAVIGGYDFVDVRDVSEGIILATEKGRVGECYILSNKYFELKNLFEIFAKVMNKKPIKIFLPLWFAKLTAPISELYYKTLKQTPLYTSYSLYTLQSNSNFSNEKAMVELGYTTRPFEETVKDTVNFLIKIKRI